MKSPFKFSPNIMRFLKKLALANGVWDGDDEGLRQYSKKHGDNFCPITKVYYKETKKFVDVSSYRLPEVLRATKLTRKEANQIVTAADYSYDFPSLTLKATDLYAGEDVTVPNPRYEEQVRTLPKSMRLPYALYCACGLID